jgi:hypothetical protein
MSVRARAFPYPQFLDEAKAAREARTTPRVRAGLRRPARRARATGTARLTASGPLSAGQSDTLRRGHCEAASGTTSTEPNSCELPPGCGRSGGRAGAYQGRLGSQNKRLQHTCGLAYFRTADEDEPRGCAFVVGGIHQGPRPRQAAQGRRSPDKEASLAGDDPERDGRPKVWNFLPVREIAYPAQTLLTVAGLLQQDAGALNRRAIRHRA